MFAQEFDVYLFEELWMRPDHNTVERAAASVGYYMTKVFVKYYRSFVCKTLICLFYQKMLLPLLQIFVDPNFSIQNFQPKCGIFVDYHGEIASFINDKLSSTGLTLKIPNSTKIIFSQYDDLAQKACVQPFIFDFICCDGVIAPGGCSGIELGIEHLKIICF